MGLVSQVIKSDKIDIEDKDALHAVFEQISGIYPQVREEINDCINQSREQVKTFFWPRMVERFLNRSQVGTINNGLGLGSL